MTGKPPSIVVLSSATACVSNVIDRSVYDNIVLDVILGYVGVLGRKSPNGARQCGVQLGVAKKV